MTRTIKRVNVYLSPDFLLRNMLYVPNFKQSYFYRKVEFEFAMLSYFLLFSIGHIGPILKEIDWSG